MNIKNITFLMMSFGIGYNALQASDELMKAIYANNIDKVESLIGNGENINAVNNLGSTPLIIAASRGQLDMVLTLLNKGAHIDAVDRNGNTALLRAGANQCIDIVKVLLEKGANVNISNLAGDKFAGDQLLFIAIIRGDLDLLKLLIDKGASVNARDRAGYPPLMVAILLNSDIDIIKLLLQAGASVNYRFNANFVALQFAVQRKRIDVIKLLLENGASINLKVINNIKRLLPDSKEKQQVLSVFDALQSGIDKATLDTDAQQLLHAYNDFLQGDHSQLKELVLNKFDVMQRIKGMPNTVVWGSLTYNLQRLFKKESIKPLLYFLADTQRLRNAADKILQEIKYEQQEQKLSDRKSLQRAREMEEENLMYGQDTFYN